VINLTQPTGIWTLKKPHQNIWRGLSNLLQPPGYHHQHAQKYQVQNQRRHRQPKQHGNHDQKTRRCQSHITPMLVNTHGKAIIHNIVFRIMLPPQPTCWSASSVSAPLSDLTLHLHQSRNKTPRQWPEHRLRYLRMNHC